MAAADCKTTKVLPKLHHGEGVELAVFEKLSVDFLFPLRGGVEGDGFFVALDRHAAVLDSFELIVGQVRDGGGEDGFEAPASLLAGVIVTVSSDRPEIDHSSEECFQGCREVGEAGGEISQHTFFKTCIVSKDRALGSAEFDQESRDFFRWISS